MAVGVDGSSRVSNRVASGPYSVVETVLLVVFVVLMVKPPRGNAMTVNTRRRGLAVHPVEGVQRSHYVARDRGAR
jgi:hypothetical protein